MEFFDGAVVGTGGEKVRTRPTFQLGWRRFGAISASGMSTNFRSSMRGWGTRNSGVSIVSLP